MLIRLANVLKSYQTKPLPNLSIFIFLVLRIALLTSVISYSFLLLFVNFILLKILFS